MSDHTLSWDQFCLHLLECDVEIRNPAKIRRPASVVIRTVGGDYGVAAVHRTGDVLIIDMGHSLENGEERHADGLLG